MKPNVIIFGTRFTARHFLLLALLIYVVLAQLIPSWGEFYARNLYPGIGFFISSISMVIPFAIGDLFIVLCIAWFIGYPFYAIIAQKKRFVRLLPWMLEYLLWIYVWFYMAWGLNYSQNNFYERTSIPQATFSEARFKSFAYRYIGKLNANYTKAIRTDKVWMRSDIVGNYEKISRTLGIHTPKHKEPEAKTMLFTPLASMVGVTGSMGPFFCEFTLNGDLLPTQYPATYAHEYSHLLGISSEAEANFYAYQVCTISEDISMRFCGYLSILPYVLSNAQQLLSEGEYQRLKKSIRPEVIAVYENNRQYWQEKYNPTLGRIQDWLYDLYLRGNKISDGSKNYSKVIELLISFEESGRKI